MFNDIVSIEPVRFIPFDIGTKLNKEDIEKIKIYIDERYQLCTLDKRHRAILSSIDCIAAQINERLSLYIFYTGIGLFVLKDEIENYKNDILLASEYLNNWKNNHLDILSWKHPYSFETKDIVVGLREIVQFDNRKARPSSAPDWEHQGLSYVMSIIFIRPSNKVNMLSFDCLPECLQKGIPLILNPSLINISDSLLLSQEKQMNNNEIEEILFDIRDIPEDHEQKRNIMAFMSWASVIIIGNVSDLDLKEWELLEVNLQYHWFYIYCLEQALPDTQEDLKNLNFTVEDALNLKIEAAKMTEDVQFINDSSVPHRFRKLIKGLIQSSEIMELLRRYIKKLEFWEGILLTRQETYRKMLTPTTEVLIFAVAYLQIAPDLYKFIIDPKIKSPIAFAIVICIFLLVSYLIYIRNKLK